MCFKFFYRLKHLYKNLKGKFSKNKINYFSFTYKIYVNTHKYICTHKHTILGIHSVVQKALLVYTNILLSDIKTNIHTRNSLIDKIKQNITKNRWNFEVKPAKVNKVFLGEKKLLNLSWSLSETYNLSIGQDNTNLSLHLKPPVSCRSLVWFEWPSSKVSEVQIFHRWTNKIRRCR